MTLMRRTITTTVLGAVLAGALLVGCGSSGPSDAQRKYADAAAAADPDDFGGMKTDDLAGTSGTRQGAVRPAEEAGTTTRGVREGGFSAKAAAALVAAAVLVDCPDQKSKLPS